MAGKEITNIIWQSRGIQVYYVICFSHIFISYDKLWKTIVIPEIFRTEASTSLWYSLCWMTVGGRNVSTTTSLYNLDIYSVAPCETRGQRSVIAGGRKFSASVHRLWHALLISLEGFRPVPRLELLELPNIYALYAHLLQAWYSTETHRGHCLCTAWRNPTRMWDEKPVRKSVYKSLALTWKLIWNVWIEFCGWFWFQFTDRFRISWLYVNDFDVTPWFVEPCFKALIWSFSLARSVHI